MVVFVSYMFVSLLIDSLILGIRARADGENRNFSPASVRKIGRGGPGAGGRPAGRRGGGRRRPRGDKRWTAALLLGSPP
jgi:hypothetical protein